MTLQESLINNKMSLLQLAHKLDNIKQACSIFGVSRQHYYNVKRDFEKYGIKGLKFKERKRPIMPNQTGKLIEKKIITYSLENPSFGKDRVAMEMRMLGIYITSSGIESIWRRHKMWNRKLRLAIIEKLMYNKYHFLTPNQLQELVLKAKKTTDRHVISYFPGYLLSQDTFEVGTIKGVGKIYMQVVIDTYGSFAFAKLYTHKTALTAADILIDMVLPYYKKLNIPVVNILTDNGSEYCGKYPQHDYQLMLKLFNINHRRTRVNCPQTNGFVERFNRTVLEEFFMYAFRTQWYTSIEQLQNDLNKWMLYYNFKRPHQGYRVKGNTPAKVFLDVKNRQKLLPLH